MSAVAERLRSVRERMEAAAARAGRAIGDIELVAVGKGHPSGLIADAHAAGQRVFGESRGQALAVKASELANDIEWHFIGPLQTNKVRIVRPHVSLLHSLDRTDLVGQWLKGPSEAPPALLQVNIGLESQKMGVEPDAVIPTFERWEEMGINLKGIMAIPPRTDETELVRPYFVEMREICDRLVTRMGRPMELSIGMTNDYEIAVEEGSTMIRVGRAIFGVRPRVDLT